MTPQELKNSILQLAIQGKLVEQRPEEGTAAELLEKILAAKGNLTRRRGGAEDMSGGSRSCATGAGEGKGGLKHLPKAALTLHGTPSALSASPRETIPDDEKPFDIPESWEWVRLGGVISLLSGRDLEPNDYSASPKKYPYMTGASNFANGNLLVNRWTDHPVTVSHLGDLLITCKGTVGAMAFNAIGDIHIARQIMAISSESIELHYVKVFLAASVQSLKAAANSMIPGVDRKTMLFRPIPLPPLAEQKRIVAKIEELLPLIDRYEKAWSKLEGFNRRFPVDMQKSLLQMAIQGKLVEQRPEEGTGEELYRQIQAEKQRLVKSGKIKKEKSLPEITEDEIPFEIPDSWMWTRLGEISWFFDAGKSPSCLKQPVKDKEWGVITTTSIQIGFFDETQNKVLPNGFSVNKSMQVRPKDILITRAGPMSRTGVACLVRAIRHNLILSDKTVRINMTDNNVYKNYIVKVLNSPQIRQFIINLMSGMDKQQVNISQKKFKTVLIPLPPLAEQKRIVAKLEEILPLCERLK
ncbi:MAG: restriction endonuclease subunit S [Kiritimatiellae bacterium]|nr:restriction endonuclease subunit S [Kiritimatiellia bacterium]